MSVRKIVDLMKSYTTYYIWKRYPDYLRKRCEKFTPLTQTELHVLTLIADGRSNVQIADYLDISVNTVKFHCKNIFQKLDTTNRQQAIKTAQELKLLRK